LRENVEFWSKVALPLNQEIIFASTGTKNPKDAPWKYVQAFAGSDIQTNPPATNDAVQRSGLHFSREVDRLEDRAVMDEIDGEVDFDRLERVLMEEGIKKFADPQKMLLSLISHKRSVLAA
jgi:transaldolase